MHPVNLLDLILIHNVLVRLLQQLGLCVKPIALHCNLLVRNIRQDIIKLRQILRSLELLLMLSIRAMMIDVYRTRSFRLPLLLVLFLIDHKRLEIDFDRDPWLLLYRNVLYFFNVLVLAVAASDFRFLLIIIMRKRIRLIIVRNLIAVLQPCFLLRMPVLV